MQVWGYNVGMLSIKLSENNGRAPEAVPYMPAGLSEICCTVNGRAGKRTVLADEEAVERLNADLQDMLQASAKGEKARPVLLFDHKAGAAAAVPKGFEWDEQRGILLRVEWTQAGRAAVEGGNYGYVSPAFRLEHGSDLICGLQNGVEVGSLVNDPAFQRNECIAAAKSEPEDVVVHAANPYGCNQYGHEWRGKHDKYTGQKRTAEEKRADAFIDSTEEERRKSFHKWKQEVEEAAQKAKLFISQNYKNMDEKNRKEAERLKEEANKKAKKLNEKVRSVLKRRGVSEKDIEDAAKYYPEKIDFNSIDYVYTPVFAANLAPFCDVENVVKSGDNIDAAGSGCENQPENTEDMETIKKMLGLDSDATPADVAAAIAALKKKHSDGQKRLEEVEAECKQHKTALEQHKEKAADGFIDRLRKGGKASPKDEETLKAAREMYMENPERTERIYAAMQPICPTEDKEDVQAGRVPVSTGGEASTLADIYATYDF